MKKIIIIGAFLLLILLTAILFISAAISSYNYDINNATDDKWVGFGSILTLMVGGFVVFYESDLFYTVYYFLVKPKTVTKSILNVVSNLTLLSIAFTDSISKFLFKYVSKIFREEIIVLFALAFVYIVLRITCFTLSVIQTDREEIL